MKYDNWKILYRINGVEIWNLANGYFLVCIKSDKVFKYFPSLEEAVLYIKNGFKEPPSLLKKCEEILKKLEAKKTKKIVH